MRTRDLEVFLACCEQGSTVGAASVLHTAQSSVSKTVLRFEKRVGAVLFTRTATGLTLTHAGVVARRHAEEVLTAATAFERAVRAADAISHDETVSVAIPTHTGVLRLVDVITQLRSDYPNLTMQFHHPQKGAETSLEGVRDGKFDLALVSSGKDGVVAPWAEVHRLSSEPIVLCCAADSILAAEDSYTRTDLACVDLISLPEGWGITTLAQRYAGLHVRPSLTVTSFEAAMQLAQRGAGACLVPASVAARVPSLHSLLPRDDFRWQLQLVRQRRFAASPGVAAVIGAVRRAVHPRH